MIGVRWIVAGAGAVVGLGALSGVALAGVNAIPVCVDDSEQITQDTPLAGTVAPLCSDADPADTLTYGVGSNDVANGTLVFDDATGTFTYTPDAGFVGTDDFTFFADDGFVIPQSDGASAAEVSAEALFTITVAAQVTTTTSTTTTSTTVAVAPSTATSVLARTGVDNATTAGGGFLAIGVGAGLLVASGMLVTRARRAG